MTFLEPPEDSLAGKYLLPLAEYVTRIAELLTLNAVFYAAAKHFHSILLYACVFIVSLACGTYLGIILSIPFRLISKIRAKSWKIAIAITLPGSLLMAWGAHQIGQLLSDIVKALAVGAA